MKRHVFIGTCSLFMTASLTGIPGERTEKINTIGKEVNQQGIVMSASMPKECIAGSSLNLRIKVQNNSKQEVQWFLTGQYWGIDLNLLDSKRRPVPLTQFGKVALGDGRHMGPGFHYQFFPGEQVKMTLNIARAYDLSQVGEYSLTISLRLPKGKEAIDLKIEKMVLKVVEEP